MILVRFYHHLRIFEKNPSLKDVLGTLTLSLKGQFLKRPQYKKVLNYISETRQVWCFIRYAQFLGKIFFGTFCISYNRVKQTYNPEHFIKLLKEIVLILNQNMVAMIVLEMITKLKNVKE